MGFNASSGTGGHHLLLAPICLLKGWEGIVWRGFPNSREDRPSNKRDRDRLFRVLFESSDVQIYYSGIDATSVQYKTPGGIHDTSSSFWYFHAFTCWKCIHEQSLLRKIRSESWKDNKALLHCSTPVIWSDFNHRPEEDMELTKAENGSELADKMV